MTRCPRGLDASEEFLEYMAELRDTWQVPTPNDENQSQNTGSDREPLTS